MKGRVPPPSSVHRVGVHRSGAVPRKFVPNAQMMGEGPARPVAE